MDRQTADRAALVPERLNAVVVLATYNERENLPLLLDRIWRTVDIDVLVIDDNSPDGTGEIAASLATSDARLSVLHRSGKQGLASALLVGFRHALDSGYELVIEMDADLSHAPEALPSLLAACTHADFAIGSRRVSGGRIIGRAAWRNALTMGACVYTRLVLGLHMRDCTSGYRCMRSNALQAVDLNAVTSKGYGFLVEFDWALQRAGYEAVEVPIVFRERQFGRSKMSVRMIGEAMTIVLKLRCGLVPPALRPRVDGGGSSGLSERGAAARPITTIAGADELAPQEHDVVGVAARVARRPSTRP